MVTCRNCGVKLTSRMNFCPLCGEPMMIRQEEERKRPITKKRVGYQELTTEIEKLDNHQKRKLIWEVISIVLTLGVSATLLLDLVINGSLNWSLYAVTAGTVIFLYTSVFAFLADHWLVKVFSVSLISGAFVLVLDLLDGDIRWSVRLGMPLLASALVVAFLTILIIRSLRKRGFNIAAYVVLAVAIMSLAVNGILSIYATGQLFLGWSVIVLFSALLMAAGLFYIHYRVRDGANLRKFFHI